MVSHDEDPARMTDVVDTLLKLQHGPSFFEAYEVRAFICHRRKHDGETQRVTVEILDAGPTSTPDRRYRCRAVSEDGRRAAGSHADTIDRALATVRWSDLDQPVARNV
jgi:hypothetical protein